MKTILLQIGEPKMWADFGLAGLVIFALFSGGLAFLGWVVKHLSTVTKMHHAERAEWRESGMKERAEWRAEHLAERMEILGARTIERKEMTTALNEDRQVIATSNEKMINAISELKNVLIEMKATHGQKP